MRLACFQLQGIEFAETYHEWIDEESIREQVEQSLFLISENQLEDRKSVV